MAEGGDAVVAGIEFDADASSYQFNFQYPQPEHPKPEKPGLTIAGQGVTNASGNTQSFVIESAGYSYKNPQLQFIKSANAGDDSVSYVVGPATPDGYGGGVLGFSNNASAGKAQFTVKTGAGTPPKHSTVGAEVSFGDSATAAHSTFTIWGSTSLVDGDTFGNVVFHQVATASLAMFINKG